MHYFLSQILSLVILSFQVGILAKTLKILTKEFGQNVLTAKSFDSTSFSTGPWHLLSSLRF